jgi:hypothetical protein
MVIPGNETAEAMPRAYALQAPAVLGAGEGMCPSLAVDALALQNQAISWYATYTPNRLEVERRRWRREIRMQASVAAPWGA